MIWEDEAVFRSQLDRAHAAIRHLAQFVVSCAREQECEFYASTWEVHPGVRMTIAYDRERAPDEIVISTDADEFGTYSETIPTQQVRLAVVGKYPPVNVASCYVIDAIRELRALTAAGVFSP